MTHPSPRKRYHLAALIAALFALNAAWTPIAAQAAKPETAAPATASGGGKKAMTIDDYSRWKSIGASRISPDGKWVAYEVTNSNTAPAEQRPVMHLLELETSRDTEIPRGAGAVFSDDSKWVVYNVTPAPAGRGGRGGRGGGGGGGGAGGAGGGGGAGGDAAAGAGGRQNQGAAEPAQTRHTVLRNLQTGTTKQWNEIGSFTFNAGTTHLLLRRGGGGGGGAGGRGGGGGGGRGGAAPAAPVAGGSDALLHDLASGRDQHLGSVADIQFNQAGQLLAYTVDAAVKDGNGLFVIDLASGRVNPIDNDAKTYRFMSWNDDGTAIAVLKGAEVTGMRERSNVLAVFPDIRGALGATAAVKVAKLDPATAAGFPRGWVVSDRGGLNWSDDSKKIFFAVKEQMPVPDTAGQSQRANVDVWRTSDERIQSLQIIRAQQDLNATYQASFTIATERFLQLTDSTMRTIALSADGKWGVGQDARAFVSDYERARPDFYRVNLETGERTVMMKNEPAATFGITPDSKYFIYWKDAQFQAYDLNAMTTRTLTKNVPVSFVNLEFDHPGTKPPYGVAGYTTDEKSILLQHKYDTWVVSLDGSEPPRNLTQGLGAKNETRFAYIRTDSAAAGGGGRGGRGGGGGNRIDITKPMLLSAYGEYTKKAGFYELRDGQMREIVYDDASYGAPTKATKADKFLLTRQTFAEYPDLRVSSGLDFKASKKLTNVNPIQSEFLWGKRVLFDYKNKKGVRLQGILAVPDDYKPGEKRPMIVSFYEKNSQNMHRFTAPSFITGMGSVPVQALTEGYLVMQPDVYFNTGSSHSDMLECVEAAVKKVIEMGYVDPKKIGINGHSYGGEGAAYIGTRSKMFAAVGMGAGVTDLTHDFSMNWGWTYEIAAGSGNNGFNYYIYGQGRWGTNPWDSPELYRFESGRTHVREAVAPFLIMHGTADGTVSFQEALGMYNALRFNKKEAYLLAYPGEGHGLGNMANRRDLTIRYMQFYNHFLKGAPAPKWMTDGVPYIAKADALKGDPRE